MIDAEGYLHLSEGPPLPRFELKAATLLNRAIAVYGPSGSGKSVIVKQIMKTVVGRIDQIVVVAPTEPSNHSYEGYVPGPMISYRLFLPDKKSPKKDDGHKGALRFLDSLWKRQEMSVAIYQQANRPATLASLFHRLSPRLREPGRQLIEQLNGKREKVIGALGRQALDPAELNKKRTLILDKFREMLCLVYKKFIAQDYQALWDTADLSEDEKYCLMYLNHNPRLLVILDDCAADLKKLLSSEILRKFFYQNRHNLITFVGCFQDDTDLITNLRKNAFVSFFANENVCTCNFDRGANGFGKAVKRYMTKIAPEVFQGNRKLAYVREDPTGRNYYYYDEPPPAPFKFGSPALWELCNQVQAGQASIDTTNPFYHFFRLDENSQGGRREN